MNGATVSVVVAVWQQSEGITECLDALSAQHEEAHEIIVVSSMSPPHGSVERYPQFRWIEAGSDGLIPHLWMKGIDAASGSVVAITTARFVPGDDWISQIRAAHQRHASPAIGGGIDPPERGCMTGWATYLLRYGKYIGWHDEGPVSDLAGDNASYKREALAEHRATLGDGFWEPDFHRAVCDHGAELIFVPAIRVTQHTSLGFARFCRQRYHHGRQFGGARARRWGPILRAFRLALSPMIPAVVLLKIVRHSLRDRRFVGALCYSFPVLVCFVLAWSAGEVRGYLDRRAQD